MANCPNINCKHQILWDWDNDEFTSVSTPMAKKLINVGQDNAGTIFKCSCGCVLGTVFEDGSVNDKFKVEIDWELAENCVGEF